MGKYLILLFMAFASLASAQLPRNTASLPSYWTVYHSCSSAPCVWTIQKTASTTKKLNLREVNIYCASAGTVIQERDGSAASGNTITPKLVNPEATYTAAFTAHSGSSSSGGTVIADALNVPATTNFPLDLKDIYLIGNATTINYTVRMSAGAGNCSMLAKVQQYD